MQLEGQLIYDVYCTDTGDHLCSLDAVDEVQAAERIMEILSVETFVQIPLTNVHLKTHEAGTSVENLYFPHAYFVLQKLRRARMQQH